MFDEQTCLLKVPTLPGQPVELDQGHLDLRMAADCGDAVWTERFTYMIGRPNGDSDQLVIEPDRLCARDTGL